MTMTARLAAKRTILLTMVVLAAAGVWLIGHLESAIRAVTGAGHAYWAVWLLAFAALMWQVILYVSESPHSPTERRRRWLTEQRTVVSVPVYNEDADLLARCLWSLVDQTRRPDVVYVVVNGLLNPRCDQDLVATYREMAPWLTAEAATHGIEMRWAWIGAAGKRAAQAIAIRDTPDAVFHVTVDSDSMLDRRAVEEIILPFADERVGSVAGIVLAANARKNLLTRVTDLWFVAGQLIDRSAASTMGSVLVNSGPLAAYRASILAEHVDGYTTERFAGRPVEFSDDSMLTLYALAGGWRTVQQPTAFTFSAMPETVSHHLRQYLRWMRGSTIRSLWRIKYLPPGRYAFWAHAIIWAQMIMTTAVFIMLFILAPLAVGMWTPELLLVPVVIGYFRSLRYLGIRRSDDPLWSQLATFALAPLAIIWSFVVLRLVRWYGMATCWHIRWGTRGNGAEISLAAVAS